MSRANNLNISDGSGEQEININLENVANSFINTNAFTINNQVGIYDQNNQKLIGSDIITENNYTQLLNTLNSNNLIDQELLIYNTSTNQYISSGKTQSDLDQTTEINTLSGIINNTNMQNSTNNSIIVYDSNNNRLYASTSNISDIVQTPSQPQSQILLGTGTSGFISYNNFRWLNDLKRLAINMTTAPSYTVDVDGDINFTGTLRSNGNPFTVAQPIGQVVCGNGTSITSFNNFYWDSNNNRLAINKTLPSSTLDVNGTISATNYLGSAENLTNTVELQLEGTNVIGSRTFDTASTGSIIALRSLNTYSYELSGSMNYKNLTNIGSGADGPNYIKFTGVTGDSNGNYTVISERRYDLRKNASELFIGKGKETSLQTTLGPDRIRITAPQVILQGYSGIGSIANEETIATYASACNGVVVDYQGYVGIAGKTSPQYALDVAGDINYTGLLRVNGTPFQGMTGDYTNNRILIGDGNDPQTNANLTYNNNNLNLGFFDFTTITQGFNIRGTGAANTGLIPGLFSLYNYQKSAPSIQLQANSNSGSLLFGQYIDQSGNILSDGLGTSNTYGYITKTQQTLNIANVYNSSLQNVLFASNNGTSVYTAINGAINVSYNNSIHGSTNISGSLFLNGTQIEGMTGDYTINRLLLGNTTEPKTVSGLYYTGNRLYIQGVGSGGTVRIAPTTNNTETTIGFYTKNDFTQQAAQGNFWTAGLATWGVGASNFSIGRTNSSTGINSALTILANGNIGINNITPSSMLSVNGPALIENGDLTINNHNFIITGDGNTSGKILIQHDNAALVFDTSQQRMITTNDGQGNFAILNNINQDGNVIIANDACTKILMNNESGDGQITLQVTANEATIDVEPTITYDFSIQNSLGACLTHSGTQLYRANTSGFKIGEGTALQALDVNGNIKGSGNLLLPEDSIIDLGTIGGGNYNGISSIRAQGELNIIAATDTTGSLNESLVLKAGNAASGSGNISFHTADTEWLTIQNSGLLESYGDFKITSVKPNIILKQTINDQADGAGLIFQNTGNFYTWRIYRKWETGDPINSAKFSIAGTTVIESDYNNLNDYFTIDQSGNVGLYVVDPTSRLHVHDINTNSAIQITNSTTTFASNAGTKIIQNGENLQIINQQVTGNISLSTNLIERTTILSNGNVGIGTNAPTQLLEVNGTMATGSIILSNKETSLLSDIAGNLSYDANFFATGEAGADNFQLVSGQSVGGLIFRDGDRWTGIVSDNNMKGLNAVFNSVQTVSTAQIGTGNTILNTWDTNMLVIKNPVLTQGTGIKLISGSNDTQSSLGLWAEDDVAGCRLEYSGSDSNLKLYSYSSGIQKQKMLINHNSNIVFNIQGDPYNLENYGNIKTYDIEPRIIMSLQGLSGVSNNQPERGSLCWQNTGAFFASRIGYNGLQDSIQFGFGSSADPTSLTTKQEFLSDGTANKSDGTTTWGVISDARTKTNINNYTLGLNEIMQINPVTFKYNGLGDSQISNKVNVGILAQDIVNIFPDTVSIYNTKLNSSDNDTTEMYKFNPHELLFAQINAIKELKTIIDKLQYENKNLQQRVQILENKNH